MDQNKMIEEFNVQRAKMKELYLQKLAECEKLTHENVLIKEELNEMKSQLLVAEYSLQSEMQNKETRAQEEIASLQQLIQETVEESSFSKSEIDRLMERLEQLKEENLNLREQQDSTSLAPVISHVRKTIARKLGSDSNNSENLEDAARKVTKYAQEDAEVLRSLVVPLEEEIRALKMKLRTTDEELQSIRTQQTTTTQQSVPQKSAGSDPLCQFCQTKDNQILELEATIKDKDIKIDTLQKQIARFQEELSKEAALRQELETQWHNKREAHKKEVERLNECVQQNDTDLNALQLYYAEAKEEILNELKTMVSEREMIHKHLETLQCDNDFLAGKYLATSDELQNQRIDLPSSVEELQEILLKYHENLIEAKVGIEFEQRKSMSYLDEAQLLRDQLNTLSSEENANRKKFMSTINALEKNIKLFKVEHDKLTNAIETLTKKESDAEKQISELRVQLMEESDSKEKVEKLSNDLKMKLNVLQQDLANSEAVQKDFVRLSQSLQMELEKIRAVDTTVRWQDDEDIEQCPNCKSTFTVTRRKQHCRHCGTVYCEKCLSKSVPSGQRNKPARVCDVCHTLLVQNTAPYFSQAPPHSPT